MQGPLVLWKSTPSIPGVCRDTDSIISGNHLPPAETDESRGTGREPQEKSTKPVGPENCLPPGGRTQFRTAPPTLHTQNWGGPSACPRVAVELPGKHLGILPGCLAMHAGADPFQHDGQFPKGFMDSFPSFLQRQRGQDLSFVDITTASTGQRDLYQPQLCAKKPNVSLNTLEVISHCMAGLGESMGLSPDQSKKFNSRQ